MNLVGKDISRSFLITKVLPYILEKWSDVDHNFPIYIKQDNAQTPIYSDDEEFRLALSQYGVNVHLLCQPPTLMA